MWNSLWPDPKWDRHSKQDLQLSYSETGGHTRIPTSIHSLAAFISLEIFLKNPYFYHFATNSCLFAHITSFRDCTFHFIPLSVQRKENGQFKFGKTYGSWCNIVCKTFILDCLYNSEPQRNSVLVCVDGWLDAIHWSMLKWFQFHIVNNVNCYDVQYSEQIPLIRTAEIGKLENTIQWHW